MMLWSVSLEQCQFLLMIFKVCISKISNETDKFLLNYGNVFWGSTFNLDTSYHQFLHNVILNVM